MQIKEIADPKVRTCEIAVQFYSLKTCLRISFEFLRIYNIMNEILIKIEVQNTIRDFTFGMKTP